MIRVLVAAVMLVTLLAGGDPCAASLAPPSGQVIRRFAPVGNYGGHWGIDSSLENGSPVQAAGDGVVSFAGSVAGVRTVTILHPGSIRTSYSYLSVIEVHTGESVLTGATVGRSGVDHGVAALHFSMRVGGRYVDPLAVRSCPSGTIRLLPLAG